MILNEMTLSSVQLFLLQPAGRSSVPRLHGAAWWKPLGGPVVHCHFAVSKVPAEQRSDRLLEVVIAIIIVLILALDL